MQCINNSTLMQCAGAAPILCAFCCLRERAQMGVPINRGTKQNGWTFSSCKKNAFVGSKRKKKSNKNEMSKHSVKVQPFFLSALRCWINHGCPYSLASVGEYQVLHKINLRGSCIYLPLSQKVSKRILRHSPQHTQKYCGKYRVA